MATFCVVISGRLPGDRDDVAVWTPVARGFALEYAAFVERILPRLPMSVKRGATEEAATSLVTRLRQLGADARRCPDDEAQVVLERAGILRGPLPLGSLAEFIKSGERYRPMSDGSKWDLWPEAVTAQPSEVLAPASAEPPPVSPWLESQELPAAVPDAPAAPPFAGHAMPPIPTAWTPPRSDFEQISHNPPPVPGIGPENAPPPVPGEPHLAHAMPPVPPAVTHVRTSLPWEQGADPSPRHVPATEPAGDGWTQSRTTTVRARGPSRSAPPVWAIAVALVMVAVALAGYFAWSKLRGQIDPIVATAPQVTVLAPRTTPPATVAARIIPIPSRPRSAPTLAASAMGAAATSDCSADAPAPRSPEDKAIAASGRRHLTGKAVRAGTTGEIYIAEAALGYDGQCRPDPYQIYVYRNQDPVGTLAPEAMHARTDGAITDFKLIDATHLELQVSRYDSQAPACCATRIETRTVDLDRFPAEPGQAAAPVTSSLTNEEAVGPSFDCKMAQSPVELAICSNVDLAREDGAMGRAYRNAMNHLSLAQSAALKAEQRQWLREREQECGSNAACIGDRLRSRTAQLTANATGLVQ